MSLSEDIAVTAGLGRLRRGLGRYAIVIAGIALLYIFAVPLCPQGACGRNTAVWINTLGLGALIVVSLRHVLQSVRADAASLLTPAVIFPLAAALYFGFGSLSTIYASSATLSLLNYGNYQINPHELLMTGRLTFVGMTTALLAMLLVMRMHLGTGTAARAAGESALGFTAGFFLIGGAVLKYGLVLPQQYGLLNLTVPGALKTMTGLTDLGFATATYLAVSGRRNWWLIFWIFWPLHLGFSTLEFSKKVIMFAIFLPAAGAFLAHRNWKRVIPWVVFAGLAFATLQDTNTAARLTILDRAGDISNATLRERLNIMSDVVNGRITLENTASSARAAAQVWWLRLNYSGQQMRAIELYDQGDRGDWSLSFATVLIPRIFWPDKPLAESQGRDFNRLVSGNFDASTRVGMSIYADGYWQMGWLGTLVFSVVMGVILGFVTRVSYRALALRQLIYLPIVFLGVNMAALGPMGYLQKSFIGTLPIFLAYLLLIWLMQQLAKGRRRTHTPHTPVLAGVPAQ